MIQCWGLERAGLPALFASRPEEADELLRQVGVNAQAVRQQPFVTWRAGRAACGPRSRIPGQRATARAAVMLGRLPWRFGPAAREALEAAVCGVRRGPAAATGASPGASTSIAAVSTERADGTSGTGVACDDVAAGAGAAASSAALRQDPGGVAEVTRVASSETAPCGRDDPTHQRHGG